MDEIDAEILIKHYGNLKKMASDVAQKIRPDDLEDVCGEWVWGPPGYGKSHMVRAENPGYFDKLANKWWCGYDGEDAVLIDDFDLVHVVLGHHLKRWADKYPFKAEVKNGGMFIRPKKIIITSNYSPEQIFDGVILDAIIRRFRVKFVNRSWNDVEIIQNLNPAFLQTCRVDPHKRQKLGRDETNLTVYPLNRWEVDMAINDDVYEIIDDE